MSKDSLVSLIDVKKSFGNNHVLNGLNIEIPKHKISFIIGRSGEGKSVTLKNIIGILKPDSGEVWIDGFKMNDANEAKWNEARKKIGILFQDGALFDSLNIFENISFPIQNHLKMSLKDMETEVEKLLDIVGLPGIQNKYPPEISIGERKRVGLARALALKPQLLLYDEPTTSMDPLVSDLIDNLIYNTQKNLDGITSVVVSHDITSVMNIAEYIFLLHKGKIYFHGTAQEFASSKDELVRQFLTGGRKGPLEVPIA
ncbi:ATP-binding cassette domain-containing protein [Silvanigrella paludirubra]|uniref:ATP-binding cassette domain-containing protein n=1 Tax=Silvanigrella paludirubra TaxID=2499159 RepID=A0A6N6VSC0_9BACT|nr:ATP-binding cassette domain-containing protein [Silvanigrella paludirubra]KAB8037993.1 ATP-binding cassette domain-containing protein [Silvanigrella paludirubra]